jgi:dTDP-4-dehydrorhamnose reductase
VASNPPPGRIAVTGAAGLLGTALVHALRARGCTAIAAVHQHQGDWPSDVSAVSVDLTDPADAVRFVESAEADWIVHTAALTDVDRCEREPELARRVNTDTTRNLIAAVDGTSTRIAYLSTDYVFDGRDGPGREDDPPAPINVYGRTKLAGELALREAGSRHLIIRSASFLGVGGPARSTFVEAMATALRSGTRLRAATDQRSNITPVGFLAAAVVELLAHGASGIWHVAGREIISRAELDLRIADLVGADRALVEPVPYAALGRVAPRPLNGGLVVEKAAAVLTVPFPSLDQSLRDWVTLLPRV